MTYIINFDQTSCKVIVKSTEEPNLVGRGEHLFAAIDDLEKKMVSKKRETMHERAGVKDTANGEIVAIGF